LLEGAGGFDQRLSRRGDWATASGVVGIEGPAGVVAIVATDAAHGPVGQAELGGDLGWAQTLRLQAKDLVPDRAGEGLRHGGSP
jgi:hypothetical protein